MANPLDRAINDLKSSQYTEAPWYIVWNLALGSAVDGIPGQGDWYVAPQYALIQFVGTDSTSNVSHWNIASC